MKVELRWQLHNARLADAGEGYCGVIAPGVRLRLPGTPAISAALQQLAGPGLSQQAMQLSDRAERELVEGCLQALRARGLVTATLVVEGREYARIVPARPWGTPAGYDPARRYRLSRFALVRRVDAGFVVEAPTAGERALLSADALALLPSLEAREPADEAGKSLRRLLCEAGLLTEVLASGETAEEADAALRVWSVHDLAFHMLKRDEATPSPDPAPTLKPRAGGALISLPADSAGQHSSRRLADVLAARQSVRQYDDAPLPLSLLGAFLYRAARVTAMRDDGAYEATRRPYPSAGALYPLELYVIAGNCEALEFGVYHYRSEAHQLERLDADAETLRTFAALCASFTGESDARPQATLAITARMARVVWRYAGAALTLILEDTGALMQTLYLVATDLGLAPCALGTAEPDLFARATGIDRYAEPQIAGFLLGLPGKS
ncbi:MAG: SagB family peptide dehydrogenase [Chloroflexota bacterium]|nr:MAG: hypothetical protein DIU68_10150 [Chloroflexota bacterium]